MYSYMLDFRKTNTVGPVISLLNHALMFQHHRIYIYISAVKRLKYLIAINRIYVIANSKLIAINRTFLSILNVPSFIYFFHHFIFIFTWKSELACFMLMFYFIENQHCQIGRYKIKCQVNKDSAYSAVKPWLNIVFFFSSLLGT